jgi:cytochrome c556
MMLKKILVAGLFSAALTGAAFAAEAPKSVEDCEALVKKTVAMFDNKSLTDAQEDKLDTLFDALDNQCASNSFEEAAETAQNITNMVPDA